MTSDTGRGRVETLRMDDGRTLWSFDSRTKEYRREDRKADRLSNLFRPFLNSFREFTPRMKVREKLAAKSNTYVLSGAVKNRGRAEMVIDKDTLSLRSASATRLDGGSMSIAVSNEVFNGVIPPGTFKFTAPAGAKPLPDARPGGVYGRPAR